MIKRLKKIKIIFLIILTLFTFLSRPQRARADAFALGGSMYLVTLNPAILPVVLVGLMACLLLGFTISNWDELQSFGAVVANELENLGTSINDYVSGTTVKIDSNFKKAVLSAYQKTGKTLPKYNKLVDYTGGTVVHLGVVNGADVYNATDILSYLDIDFKYFGNVVNGVDSGEKSNIYLSSSSGKTGAQYNLSEITVIASVEPTRGNPTYFENTGLANTTYKRDVSGQVIELSTTLTAKEISEFVGSSTSTPFAIGIASDVPVTITDVTIPQLGIGTNVGTISTDAMMSTSIEINKADEYVNTAFPSDARVRFRTDADVRGATLTNLSNISDTTLTGSQIKTLEGLESVAISEADIAPSSGTGSSSTGGFWSLLWDWLKKIWEAIISIPSLILDGLKALFSTITDWLSKLWDLITSIPNAVVTGISYLPDWLSKIWTSITSIPGAIVTAVTGFWTDLLEWVRSIGEGIASIGRVITTAIKDALTWAFGIDGSWLKGRIEDLRRIFNSKFPAIKAIDYRFSDKATFDDLTMTIPNVGTVVVVKGSVVMQYGSILKNFLRAFFYLITALFFFKRFYKVAED